MMHLLTASAPPHSLQGLTEEGQGFAQGHTALQVAKSGCKPRPGVTGSGFSLYLSVPIRTGKILG